MPIGFLFFEAYRPLINISLLPSFIELANGLVSLGTLDTVGTLTNPLIVMAEARGNRRSGRLPLSAS
jgi:hypothetical protein